MGFDVIKEVLVVSQLDEGKKKRDCFRVLGKLTEECGEAATIVNKPDKKHPEGMNGEVADIVLAAVDLLYVHIREQLPELSPEQHAGIAETLLKKAAEKKILKWKENYF